MARLPRLMGRGRALEVLLGADDIPGELAERYGYVNRSFPDAELDVFVDSLANRIASFDKQALSESTYAGQSCFSDYKKFSMNVETRSRQTSPI